MNKTTRSILLVTLTAALAFGFLHLAAPETRFERLHIFLFNLVSGGTAILMYSRRERGFTPLTAGFLVLALAYAVLSFAERYLPAIVIAVVLALLVDSVRIRRYGFLPLAFFNGDEPVEEKFNQASLLCLSLGLLISALVMINHEYLHIITSPKFTLDIFFLGFSFPVSLITMSLMFGMMEGDNEPMVRILKNISFWLVNLGVIVFFLFILVDVILAELFISVVLFVTVVIIYWLYARHGRPIQPKTFLTSGALFLIATAVTGIAYIVLYVLLPDPPGVKFLLRLHAFASLYGWNLNGLIVMARHGEFPLRLHRPSVIGLHWLIVFVAAPLGLYLWPAAVAALMLYTMFLLIVLFTPATTASPMPPFSK